MIPAHGETVLNFDTIAIRRLRDSLLSPADDARERRGISADLEAAMLRRVEPFAETMYLVMIADGDPASVEHAALASAIEILTDQRLTRPAIDAMIGNFEARAANSGAEACVARLGALFGADRDDREIAFTLAAAIAVADDRVDVRENRVVGWVREYFGISDRRAAALVAPADHTT